MIPPAMFQTGKPAMQPADIIEVDDDVVACDGNGGPLGHPRVFLHFGDRDQLECPYCSRKFRKRGSGHIHGPKSVTAAAAAH